MQPIATGGVVWSVMTMSRAKTAELTDAIWDDDSDGAKEPCILGVGPDAHM